jgi:hypothetical protein
MVRGQIVRDQTVSRPTARQSSDRPENTPDLETNGKQVALRDVKDVFARFDSAAFARE